MAHHVRSILINIDLPQDIFSQVTAQLGQVGGPSDHTIVSALTADEMDPLPLSDAISLWLFVERQNDRMSKGTKNTAAQLLYISEQLSKYHTGPTNVEVHLVDCGERPSAPLSDLGVLAQYLESISENIYTEATGTVYALNYALSDKDDDEIIDVELLDTRSAEFIQHTTRYYMDALKDLNQGFGQGQLPTVISKAR